jgi:hypothetical protein
MAETDPQSQAALAGAGEKAQREAATQKAAKALGKAPARAPRGPPAFGEGLALKLLATAMGKLLVRPVEGA